MDNDRRFVWLFLATIVIMTAAFIFLRGRYHFLGDGYTLLSLIEEGSPLAFKTRAFGEAFLRIRLYELLGAGGEADALLSFQIVSVFSGVLLVALAALFSFRLFEDLRHRTLFFLGIVFGAHMLHYFGYVEYYALFVLTVFVFTLTGLLVVQGKISRWLLLPSLFLAAFFHVFGVVLVIPALYALAYGTSLSHYWSRLPDRTRLGATTLMVVVFMAIVLYSRSFSHYLLFAFVPLFDDQYAVEGYTLLSSSHIIDCLNIVVLFVPGILLFIVSIIALPLRKLWRQAVYRFLVLTLGVTWGCVFLFEADLGMPRDWDLFSFAGVVLLIACYYTILANSKHIPKYRYVASLAIVLSLLSLSARVVTQIMPDVSVAHFRDYIYLDIAKNRSARLLLVNFYKTRGEIDKAAEADRRWAQDFAEESWFQQAKELRQSGRLIEAKDLYGRIVNKNSSIAMAWCNLGNLYLELGPLDSAKACLLISAGLNPDNPTILTNLGFVHAALGEFDEAELVWLQAVHNDSTQLQTHLYLLQLYETTGRVHEYKACLLQTAAREDAPAEVLGRLGEYYAQQALYQLAADALRRGVERGLDTAVVQQLRQQYPILRPLLP